MSADNQYSSTNHVGALSHHLISILLTALVCTLAFLVRVSVICAHKQIWRGGVILLLPTSVMLTPFSTALSCAKFMRSASLSSYNQIASSTATSIVLQLDSGSYGASELRTINTPLASYDDFLLRSCYDLFYHCG